MEGTESFCLIGNNKKAVLLLHGYTGSPAEMKPLGIYLNNLGYTVLCPCLPGHGTTVEDLAQKTTKDWLATAKSACRELKAQYKIVYVAGLSMGGLLSMKIAAEENVKKAVIISAPIYVFDKRVKLLPLLRFFIHYLPKRKRNYHGLDMYCQAYDRMPTKPLLSLFALIEECKLSVLKMITIPTLVLQSKIEHTVKPKSAQYIFDNIRSKNKKIVWLEHSGHILTLDCEHEKVFKLVGDFFEDKEIEG